MASSIEADAIVRNTLLVMVLFFVGAVLVTSWLSQRFLVRPIAEILGRGRTITMGDLNISVPVTSNNEFGELASSFSGMTDELNTAFANLPRSA
ncbi:MAG: HAMP domain-containing protein [Chloroflexi bacterium]|nr:HAMP domain-containing protein [Chloroflexota bacterium]